MKTGANKSDAVKIKKMAENGDDADYISHALQIELDVVKSFMPKKKESKSKAKLAESSSE
jgi:hypothetical protein